MGWFSRTNKAMNESEVNNSKKLTATYKTGQVVNVFHPLKQQLQVGKIVEINNFLGTLTIEFAGGFKTVIDPDTEPTFNPRPSGGAVMIPE